MDYRSLTAPQRRAYERAVSTTHRREIELLIMTKDGKPVRSLTNRILGGNISGDDARTPVELLEAQIFDDDQVLHWRFGGHRQYKARVTDSRFVSELDEWVDDVIFTGPLRTYDRTDAVVSLAAQGSERLAMGSIRRVFHRSRKSRATAVVKDLLKAAGAPDHGLRIPSRKAKLPKSVTVGVRRGRRRDTNGKKAGKGKDNRPKVQIAKFGRQDTYWGKAEPIVQAMDCDLFADGHGAYVMAPPPGRPMAVLTDRQLLSPAKEKPGNDDDETNTWLILGPDPKGPKDRVHVEVGLPPSHPSSAKQQAWHGNPFEVTEVIENRHIRRREQARKLGKRKRDQAMRELVEYEVEVLPVLPWFRAGALVSIPTPGGRVSMRVHQWTRPLGPDASPMTLGANRRNGWR